MTYKVNNTLVINRDSAYVHESFTQEASLVENTETKILASDGAANDFFGHSVAVGNGRIVVGAYEDDDNGSGSGSAYIFDLDGTQLTKITPSDGAAEDKFGLSVAVGSGRIVIGAYLDDDIASATGSAYIFDLDGNELTKITASDAASIDLFGYSVAVGNGRIVVGAIYDDDNGSESGSAYIFDLNGTELTKITASDGAVDDHFGHSVAVGNGRIVVGSIDDNNSTGSAYIFDLNGNELTKITASDGTAGDEFGRSVSIGCGRIVIGAYNNEAAYIFDLSGKELAKITPSDGAAGDNFGWSVAVGSGRIVVCSNLDDHAGGTDAGGAYIFDLDGNEIVKITANDAASNDNYGRSIAINNSRIVVGTNSDDNAGGTDAGSAYIYNLSEDHNTFWESIIDGLRK